MHTQTLGTYSWDTENSVWQKALWLTAVMLTLGLCLVAWKRSASDAVAIVEPAVAMAVQVQETNTTPVRMIVKVSQFYHRPVWASALSEVGLMEEEYPQAHPSSVE